MNKEEARAHSERERKSRGNKEERGIVKLESRLPEGSWQRTALGIAVATGGGLLATALVGVGPAAVAGAAGYLAYRELRRPRGEEGEEEQREERKGRHGQN